VDKYLTIKYYININMATQPHILQSCRGDKIAFYRGSHVILGGTVAGSIFANRLLAAGVSTPIFLVYDGFANINAPMVKNLNFLANTFGNIIEYLNSYPVTFTGDGGTLTTTFYVARGLHGEFISSYYIPRIGPWFVDTNDRNFVSLVDSCTSSRSLTDTENIVANSLARIYHAVLTPSLFATGPSIMDHTRAFVDRCGNSFIREVFQNLYAANCEAPNIMYVCYNTDLKIQPITKNPDTLNNAMGSGIVAVKSQITWMADPFTYAYMHANTTSFHTTGGEFNNNTARCLKIPSIYRAIVAIPEYNEKTGIDLSNQPDELGDLITSYLAFTFPGFCSPCMLEWRGCCYTAKQDLASTEDPILVAPDGYTLLIVEAVNIIRQRTVQYNKETGQVTVFITNECEVRRSFADLVANIYRSYTGTNISINQLLNVVPMTTGTVSTTFISIQPYVRRRTPLETILLMSSFLYGTEIFPQQTQ